MTTKTSENSDLGFTLGILLIRIWLGVRAIVTGLEKYAGTKAVDSAVEIDGAANAYGLTETSTEKAYALSNYQGVPASLYEKFSKEPLIPDFALNLYNTVLGPALLILGVTLLLGIATRISLFLTGLVYTSLTLGLILIKQDAGIAWLAAHIILVVMGLALANYNRLAILKKW